MICFFSFGCCRVVVFLSVFELMLGFLFHLFSFLYYYFCTENSSSWLSLSSTNWNVLFVRVSPSFKKSFLGAFGLAPTRIFLPFMPALPPHHAGSLLGLACAYHTHPHASKFCLFVSLPSCLCRCVPFKTTLRDLVTGPGLCFFSLALKRLFINLLFFVENLYLLTSLLRF